MSDNFLNSTPTANPVFYRTYSRRTEKGRETWEQVVKRTVDGIKELGKLTETEAELIEKMQSQLKCLTSGRWLWVGGVDWLKKSDNFYGAYNCTGMNVTDWHSFGMLMDLAMMGCGTGAVLEEKYISNLPPIRNRLRVKTQGQFGTIPPEKRGATTVITALGQTVFISVGDSRQGWVGSYQGLLELSTDESFNSKDIEVIIDLSHVRPAGEALKGFGGVSNPVKLEGLYSRCAEILNGAIGRQLNSVECCLLIDEAALVVVAGNVRRSAGLRQSDKSDELFANAKKNLWQEDNDGNWKIDPKRDALRMSNHTRVYHSKPTLEEIKEAVTSQYYSGEGAIQWAGEAIARANVDLLTDGNDKIQLLEAYGAGTGKEWIKNKIPNISPEELEHRLSRYSLNPCGK